MKKVLKWAGIGMGGLVILLVVAVAVLVLTGQSRLGRAYAMEARPVDIPGDAATVERGQHLVTAVVPCVGCHGEKLEGKVFLDEAPIGRVVAPNLTSGEGGVGGNYTDMDWVRILRHGIRPDGTPVLPMMPSGKFAVLSDEDLAAVIAYVKSVPPVDKPLPSNQLAFTGKIIMGVLENGNLPVQQIDHQAVQPATVEPSVTAAYGQYLLTVALCQDCHGENLAGGVASPSDPYAPNLTPTGNLASWTEDDFLTMFRTGIAPGNRQISPAMPYEIFGRMTDDELKAIWLYLQTVPSLPDNPQ
ncbi:MAG: cytochrome C [Chloroflexi bacterium]|nr:MAG: cytochrome C [Chloroflexota bacterium]